MSYYMEVSSCPTLPLSWVPNCPVPNCPVSKCPVPSCPVSSCPGFEKHSVKLHVSHFAMFLENNKITVLTLHPDPHRFHSVD